MKPCIAAFLFVVLMVLSSGFVSNAADSGFCDPKCSVRCSVASAHERCLKYCGICCEKCGCVPPGTSGNKDACPCYRDWYTSKGTPKCP